MNDLDESKNYFELENGNDTECDGMREDDYCGSYLYVEHTREGISFKQAFRDGFWLNDEDYEPPYMVKHCDLPAEIFCGGEKYKWIINNLIDLIKGKLPISTYEEKLNESEIITTSLLRYKNHLTIAKGFMRNSHFYEQGEVHIRKEAYKKLKEILFNIKSTYKI